MHSFIIHMSSSTARRPNAERLLDVLPNARLIEAIDGRDPAQVKGVQIMPGTHLTPRYPFPIGPGEIGCFLSHRKCWQAIVDGDAPYAMIVEDDLAINPVIWPDVLKLIERHATADSFIRIPAKKREAPITEIETFGVATLFVPRVTGLQTVCQVVGRNAAQRLLAATETLDRPVDTFLQMHWATGQTMLSILPNGVRELTAETGGSTIQKKTRTSGKLMRELRRAWYRTQVWMRPQDGQIT
ncbi:MAG: glycosyltransferase family 25 protein [Sulfitobacter sp.]